MTIAIVPTIIGAAILGCILGVTITSSIAREKIDEYKDALRWCGGSADFNDGGKARIGWLKIAHLTK